jgi:hypothetical protein
MPYQSVGPCYTHFPADVMMNEFDLSHWNCNNEPNDSIDLIKDYYNLMADRLRHQILDASPHARI